MSARAAILISGSGSNLQAFIDAVASGELELEIAVVFSNNPDAFGLERARKAGIPTACLRHGDFADRNHFDEAVISELDRFAPDLVILAGFMRILSPLFVKHFEGRVLNIHPALLPKYPGLHTHQRAIDAGDEWHGSTVHFVTEELDAGPLILQGRLRIAEGESADELKARVQSVEHQIYPRAAGWVASGRVRYVDGETEIDGKAAPEPQVETFDI